MASLQPNQLLRCVHSQAACRVVGFIGDGGQGEVHEVDVQGGRFALKWYHDRVLRVDRTLARRLQVAVDLGAPSRHFLWPFELVTLPDGSRLGYLMPLRQPGHLKIHAVLAQQVRPSFRVLAALCGQLTQALLALHAKGLVYQDLNAGNVFFDPVTGDVEICDNDNVDIDGAPSVMGGVWEFQAPEVVLRHAGPSRATDLHSLAVMLFRVLHIGHPLVGACEWRYPNLSEANALRRVFGSEARFVFDPHDDSNRPLPDRHGPVLGHWAIYPQFLRELFTRAFTEGLFDPLHGRVQESEWLRAMRQLHDAVHTCPSCGAQNFYCARRLSDRQPTHACWHCGAALPSAPTRLGVRRPGARVGDPPLHVIVLEPGALLQRYHLGLDDPAGGPVGTVEADGATGLLRNTGAAAWQATLEGGLPREVPVGEAVTLVSRLQLRFGPPGAATGEVKWAAG